MRAKGWMTTWVVAALATSACAPGEPSKEEGTPATTAQAPRDAITQAAWSRDGRRIAVSWYRGNRSRVYGVFAPASDGAMPEPSRGLPITAGQGEHATWSPDGLWVAFATTRDGNSEIYRVRPDGTGAENLTRSPSGDAEPAYSPDGKFLAFTSDRDGGAPRLYVMGADGSNPRLVADDLPGTEQHDPAWSPDGRVIAFVAREGAEDSIYVATVVGGGWGKLGEGDQPAWSADGGHIFYSENDSIFARRSNGGARGFVLADGRAPAPSPDGHWLAFVRGSGPTVGLYLLDLESKAETRITP